MTKKRVSNEQILSALTDLPAQIAAALQGTQVAAPVAEVRETSAPKASTASDLPKVPESYLNVMRIKAASYADKVGEDVVLYLRTNTAGQNKIGFCKASGYADKSDARIIGALEMVSAS